MYVAANGNKEIVVLLLDNGGDINDKDEKGNTVLSVEESKNKELIEFIEGKLIMPDNVYKQFLWTEAATKRTGLR